jgi:hypothetical protein
MNDTEKRLFEAVKAVTKARVLTDDIMTECREAGYAFFAARPLEGSNAAYKSIRATARDEAVAELVAGGFIEVVPGTSKYGSYWKTLKEW